MWAVARTAAVIAAVWAAPAAGRPAVGEWRLDGPAGSHNLGYVTVAPGGRRLIYSSFYDFHDPCSRESFEADLNPPPLRRISSAGHVTFNHVEREVDIPTPRWSVHIDIQFTDRRHLQGALWYQPIGWGACRISGQRFRGHWVTRNVDLSL